MDVQKTGSLLQQHPVAIIGMASIFPQSRMLQEYWEKIINGIDCITDVPPSRWKSEDYYSSDPSDPDKTYCRRGGFLPDIDFDPMEFGIPPAILEATDISQLLSLIVAKEALADAGYGDGRAFDRERVGVVLGVAGGTSQLLHSALAARLQYPLWKRVMESSGLSAEEAEDIARKISLAYPEWQENSFPGLLGNVIAGRISNRLDLGGGNCVVDAACASSLSAIKLALSDLVEQRCDMVITGGVDVDNSPVMYMCFSKTPALSKTGAIRPFDEAADGTMLGEGIGMLVLKRLSDAERDGDRIYAVIRGIGVASDGRYKSIYAPRPEGQARALRRAYEDAGISPATVQLVEAHGTGTMAGDASEFRSLCDVYEGAGAAQGQVALGSVKSQIGHTKAAAGAASLIKVGLALYHKLLPPTINVSRPHPELGFEESPFYLNTVARPWRRAAADVPRRAAVSAFGFGGTNYHLVLEEHQPEHRTGYRLRHGPAAVLLAAGGPAQLQEDCRRLSSELRADDAEERFRELARLSAELIPDPQEARLGFVAASAAEAAATLAVCAELLGTQQQDQWEHPSGIRYQRMAGAGAGAIAALFSGQGSQYVGMGRELFLQFPPLRQHLAAFDQRCIAAGSPPLSDLIFPAPAYDHDRREAQSRALQQTEHAQPAIGAVSAGLYTLLQQMGLSVAMVGGHSFGELTALWAAGALSDGDYYTLVCARGRAMSAETLQGGDAGAMLAVKGDLAIVQAELAQTTDVAIANTNSPSQVVVAGATRQIEALRLRLSEQGVHATRLPVSAAFHTPYVAHAQQPFAQAIQSVNVAQPRLPVYSNTTAAPYPTDPAAIRGQLAEHMLRPVQFKQQIEQMYADGARCFIEFGPRGILASLVRETLAGRPHLAIALNASPTKDSDRQLQEALAHLRVAGVPLGSDPYAAQPAPPKRPQSRATIRLSGSNYRSESGRAAFEQALATPTIARASVQQATVVAAPELSPFQPADNRVEVVSMAQSQRPAEATSIPGSVEQGLTPLSSYYSDQLRVHELYLQQQAEYVRLLHQLMQQQLSVCAAAGADPAQAALISHMLESFERSLARLQEHQGETLRVHEAYLSQQLAGAHMLVGAPQASAVPAPLPARPIAAPQALPVAAPPAQQRVVRPAVQLQPAAAPRPAQPPSAPPVLAPSAPIAASRTHNGGPRMAELLLEIVSQKTGYPSEMLSLEMDMEADLGIDSIKRVEIMGAMQERLPAMPQANAAALAKLRTLAQIVAHIEPKTAAPLPPSAAAQPGAMAQNGGPRMAELLLEIVSQKTGYPSEMLNLEMDMEADLGIDSIKRVEIMGAMQERLPAMPQANAAALAKLRTLAQIAAYIDPQPEQKKKLS